MEKLSRRLKAAKNLRDDTIGGAEISLASFLLIYWTYILSPSRQSCGRDSALTWPNNLNAARYIPGLGKTDHLLA
jgi:hypothetical protein